MPLLLNPYVSFPSAAEPTANVLATGLEAHYTFDGASPLSDKSGNGRNLSVLAGTPPGINSNGYELNTNDEIGWEAAVGNWFLTDHDAYTLQAVVIPEDDGSFQRWLGVRDQSQSDWVMAGTEDSSTGMGGDVSDNQGDLVRCRTNTSVSTYTTTGVLLTMRWDGVGGDIKVRINKEVDTVVSNPGTLSVDKITIEAGGNSTGFTVVYAVAYSSVLTDTQVNDNYNAIRDYVNSRPNVDLPGYSPLDEGANLALWLDASDTGTITTNSDGVTQWNDKSGNANHATQGSATFSDYLQTGTRTVNGLNALDSDGGSTHVGIPNPEPVNNFSLYFVIQCDDKNRAAMINSGAGSGFYGLYDSADTTDADLQFNNPEYFINGVSAGSNLNPDQLHAAMPASGTTFILTGVNVNNGSSGWAVPYDGIALNGALCEMVMVLGEGSDRRSIMESYLADKWGITL